MKHITTLHLIFAVLTAAFLTACSSWPTTERNSGSSNYSGGHGGHH